MKNRTGAMKNRDFLNEKNFEIFRLVYMQGYSQASAAQIVGCTQQLVSYTLKKLCNLAGISYLPDSPEHIYQFDERRDIDIRQKW